MSIKDIENTATLRLTYLHMCDNNYCAAMLLDWMYAFKDYCMKFMEGQDEYEYDLRNRICVIDKDKFTAFGLFKEEDISPALLILQSKGYIASISFSNEQDNQFYIEFRPESVNPTYWQNLETERAKALKEEEELQHNHRLETKRVTYHLKRAETLALPATLTLEQWLATLEYFEWQCAYCQQAPYQVFEHFTPLFHGGGTTYTNCVPACCRCNAIKSDSHPSVFKDKIKNFEPVQNYLRSCSSIEELS